jgi:antitoxin CptB
MTATLSLARLNWQCRRGTQELDLLLSHYLNQHYSRADSHEQQQFQQLLALADSELLQLLLTDTPVEIFALTSLVNKIRRF